MRAIQVSTEVFAAIWAAHKPGERDENDILARVLGVTSVPARPDEQVAEIGYRDSRFGVELRDGFEIFRTYLGREYRARAQGGGWTLMDSGRWVPSLNELSVAIGAKTENAWINWYFVDDAGSRRPLSSLRDRSKIIRRSRPSGPNLDLRALGLVK